MPTTLPYYKGEMARQEEYEPIVLHFTRKDVKRCIEALEWYVQSNADEMIATGHDPEVARYEDLMYRFMGVPDENNGHVEGRNKDDLDL
jgi:hypothetical protein